MLSQEHFIGYVTTTSNNTFTNNFETNGAPYLSDVFVAVAVIKLPIKDRMTSS